MARLSKLFLLMAALIFTAQNTFADGFNSVFSKDGVNVIAVGNAGNVFMSINGGNLFYSNPVGASDLKGVYAVGQMIWIATVNGVQVSTDGGSSFNLTTVAGNTYNSVCFVDANTGWIVGTNGYIGKSTNGGASFTAQTSTVSVTLNSVKFTNASTGAACGNGGTIVCTTNGGATWTQKTTNVTNNLLCVDYKSTGIMASAAQGIVIKSVNDGSTWATINYNMASKSDVTGISMVTAAMFFSGGGGGFIRRSNDGGVNFSFQQNPMMATLSSIYFVDANTGFACASNMNGILNTHDGGATWTFQQGVSATFGWVQKQPGGTNIGNGFCLHPLNRDVLFICMGKIIYRSPDRGNTWSQIATVNTTYSTAHSFYVSPLDTTLFLCAISNGGGSSSYKLMRSTDYGASWTDILGTFSGSTYGMPLEIDENNPSVYYLNPENAVMMRSTNSGLTWSNWGNHTFRSPCDIAVTYGNPAILLLGDGVTGSGTGDFWKSVDTGKTWTMVHGVSGSEIPMIASTNLDPNLYYHTTWSSGGFWKSTDDGSNFALTSGPSSSLWASDIAKDDPTAVAYDIYGSTCYFSTDNGVTFTTTNVGSSPAAGMYYYDKANLYVQHGSGVYKLTISYTVLTGNTRISSEVPKDFSLAQNYPNPFNPTTQIEYTVSKQSVVAIKIFDVAGNEVTKLVNSNLAPGKYKVDFDASKYSSGVYFYSMYNNGNLVETKKMMLVK